MVGWDDEVDVDRVVSSFGITAEVVLELVVVVTDDDEGEEEEEVAE